MNSLIELDKRFLISIKYYFIVFILIISPHYYKSYNYKTYILFLVASVIMYKTLVKNRKLSPMIVLFLLYSYVNNCFGALLYQIDSSGDFINRYGIVNGNNIYKLPLLFIIMILSIRIVIRFRSFYNFKIFVPSNNLIFFVNYILLISLLVISSSIFINVPSNIKYIAYGINRYFSFSPFFLGLNIKNVKKLKLSILTLIYIIPIALLSSVNSRGYAIFPVVSFVLGILFYSKIAIRKKQILVIAFCAILPVYLVFANIGRIGNNIIGPDQKNIEIRLDKIKMLISGKMDIPIISLIKYSVSDRIFPLGGYAIIQKSPKDVPFKKFNIIDYFEIGSLQKEAFKYRLQDYGFLITESNSIGITLFGDFWMYGGIIAFIFGVFSLIIVIECNNNILISINKKKNVYSQIIAISQLNTFFYAQGYNLPTLISGIFTSYILSYFIYMLFSLKGLISEQ